MEPRLGHAAILVRLLALGACGIAVLSSALAASIFAIGAVGLLFCDWGEVGLNGGLDECRLHCAKMGSSTALDWARDFHARHRRWPDPDELSQLIEGARDPWGHAYLLRIDCGRAEVRSTGPDGCEGTEDDVVARWRW
jgi:hypothetical protein